MRNQSNFNNWNKYSREFTGCLFEGRKVYAGDLVEYRKGRYKEMGEVQKREGSYLVGGKPLEEREIVRVINMGKMRADGRYV
jgi:hypothetical protein